MVAFKYVLLCINSSLRNRRVDGFLNLASGDSACTGCLIWYFYLLGFRFSEVNKFDNFRSDFEHWNRRTLCIQLCSSFWRECMIYTAWDGKLWYVLLTYSSQHPWETWPKIQDNRRWDSAKLKRQKLLIYSLWEHKLSCNMEINRINS